MSIQQWGSELGKQVLEKLSTLYMKLVWESSALLTLCTPNIASQEDLSFATEDLARLTLKNIDKDGIHLEYRILLQSRLYLKLLILKDKLDYLEKITQKFAKFIHLVRVYTHLENLEKLGISRCSVSLLSLIHI